MNKHIIAECVLGAAILVLLLAIGKNHLDSAFETAKVQAKVEARAEAQKDYDSKLNERQAAWDKERSIFEEKERTLQHMTPQQIVQKVPEYVSLPSSSRPITIWGPGVATPSNGDAIVPQEDIQAIAQQVLKGNNCLSSDLPKCQADVIDWQNKFKLRDLDAKDWEKAAKKSDFGRKLKRCGILAGIGFGAGSLPNDPNRARNGAIGAGIVGIPCLFIK